MANRYYTDNSDIKITAGTPPSLPASTARKGVSPEKDSGFAGVPGATQKDRSNGIPKFGKLGKFWVKSEGI